MIERPAQRIRHILIALLTTATIGSGLAATVRAAEPITEQEAHDIGVDAYIYLYPLVTMDITRKQLTNVAAGKDALHAPMNTFANIPEYPSADLKVVVRPNFDTLYSSAWLDLTKEPMIVSVPDTGGRFYPCPCWICGRTCSRRPAGARPARRLAISSLRRPVGPARSRPE